MDDQPVQEASEDNARPAPTFRESLVRTPEGRLLLSGVILAVLYLLWVAVIGFFSENEPHVLLGMTATEILLGRAAALALGYSSGLGHTTVIPVVIVLETILVFLFYPLFVFSWNSLLVIKRLRVPLKRIRRAAETHKDKVQRYGIIGLFVFVWLPFWMTGPVVGCVIGFLLGLRTWVNITVVLAGTYVAILGWAFFLQGFQERLAAYGRYAGLVIILLIAGVLFLLQRMARKINGNKKDCG